MNHIMGVLDGCKILKNTRTTYASWRQRKNTCLCTADITRTFLIQALSSTSNV